MNRIRRNEIDKIITALESIRETLETIRDEEQEAFDNIPENLTGTDRYESAEMAVENLDSAYDGLADVIDMLTEATN